MNRPARACHRFPVTMPGLERANIGGAVGLPLARFLACLSYL